MISGGNVTVFVSNMDAAVRFYTESLGLKLTFRFQDNWATVQAGSLTIGLHPPRPAYPPPGTKGSMSIGLVVDEPIDAVIKRLRRKAVRFTTEVFRSEEIGDCVSLEDPDGNQIYLWEKAPWAEDYDDEAQAQRELNRHKSSGV